MRVTILSMIASKSLQAFSGAATTAPLNRPAGASPIRLVRDPGTADRQASGSTGKSIDIPPTRPSIPPPRGSLLNLSV